MKTENEKSHSEQQAWAQLESICEMVKALDATDNGREEAEQRIHEHPLSVEKRNGWHPAQEDGTATDAVEFKILLCTGGPAVQIRGELDSGTPTSVRLEHQDWGTYWQELHGISDEQEQALLTYCQQFYFGE